MQYCNVKMPIDMAYQMTGKDVDCMLGALVGTVDEWDDASTGSSSDGPYEEGDVMYKLDGKWWSLAYDFMDVGNGVARVFRYAIDRQPDWDEHQEATGTCGCPNCKDE